MQRIYENYFEHDEELANILKKPYFKRDTTTNNFYKNRFSSHTYVRDIWDKHLLGVLKNSKHQPPENQHRIKFLTSRTREIIYKNACRMTGRRALRDVCKYIARALSDQKEEPSVMLYDQSGTEIKPDEIKMFLDQWQEELPSDKFKKSNPEIYDLHMENEQKKSYYETLFHDGKITKEEMKDYHKTIKQDHDFNVWEKGTIVRPRNNWNQKLTIDRIENGKVIAFDAEKMICDTFDFDKVVPIRTKDGFQIFDHKKANNPLKMKKAEDDNNYSIHKKAIADRFKSIPVDFNHLIFSIGGKDYDEKAGHKAFKDFLFKNMTMRGFDYIYGYHNDTENPHYHVIVKNQSKDRTQGLWPKDKYSSLMLRKELNDILYGYGIDRSVTQYKDLIPSENKLEKQLRAIEGYADDYIDNIEATYTHRNLPKDYGRIRDKIDAFKDKIVFEYAKVKDKKSLDEIGQSLYMIEKNIKISTKDNQDKFFTSAYKAISKMDKEVGEFWKKEWPNLSTETVNRTRLEIGFVQQIKVLNTIKETRDILSENEKDLSDRQKTTLKTLDKIHKEHLKLHKKINEKHRPEKAKNNDQEQSNGFGR